MADAGRYDVVVVGAGMGGLVAGALLADAGARVLVLEKERYAGGCAATFERGGVRFNTGATVASGFHRDGPLDWLGRKLGIRWPLQSLPVAWQYMDDGLSLPLDPQREGVLRSFPKSASFWREQGMVADDLWTMGATLLNQYGRKKPTCAVSLIQALLQCRSGLLLQLSRMNMEQWLRRFGLTEDHAFIRFINAQLLISAQTTMESCNALYAALALDLPRKNPCSVIGGTGAVADALVRAMRSRGGVVQLGEEVHKFEHSGNRVSKVVSSKATYNTGQILYNGSAATLARLLGKKLRGDWQEQSRQQWGAFVLYLVLRGDFWKNWPASNVQMVRPGRHGLAETGSLFLSVADTGKKRSAAEQPVSVSISSHTGVDPWWQTLKSGRDDYEKKKSTYIEKTLLTTHRYLGDVRRHTDTIFAATPVTYARYTGRSRGLVGGYGQTGLLPPRRNCFGLKNVSLVGDHCFPGQSMAGVTVGSALTVHGLLRRV